jgi:hypothetical protein
MVTLIIGFISICSVFVIDRFIDRLDESNKFKIWWIKNIVTKTENDI